MKIFFVCLFFLSLKVFAEDTFSRSSALADIKSGCVNKAKLMTDAKEKVCQCMIDAFSDKASDQHLKALVGMYKTNKPLRFFLNKDEASLLTTFDLKQAEICFKKLKQASVAEDKP